MDYGKLALKKHKEWNGKIEVIARCELDNKDDLSTAYTPGVASPCLEIQKDVSKSYTYTRRGNLVAVVTDGTAVLGLGDIGPEAGMPVMEGKCALFKAFGDVDAIPLCIRSKNVDDIVNTISLLAGSFGGINLEDISAPRCFEIEKKLQEKCDIPIFHDDQHGTAVVVLAGLINALKLANKKLENIKLVMQGCGAAGTAIVKLLLSMGLQNVVMVDKIGALWDGMDGLSPAFSELAKMTNKNKIKGTLPEVIKGADVFIGVSGADCVSEDMVKSMADKSIIFAMANPNPEITPDKAKKAGCYIIGTGRSDHPNQINNVLAFPGIFRGALDSRASVINDAMKIAAAKAIADFIPTSDLTPEYIIPSSLDKSMANAVAKAVLKASKDSGVSRL